MTELRNKDYTLTLDRTRIRGLDVSFEVQRSTRHEPNKATIKVWNLNPDHRRELQSLSRTHGPGRIACQLDAGYVGSTQVIFSGQLQTASSVPEGPNFVTSVEGQDSGHAYRTARVNESFAPGTSIEIVARRLVAALGVGEGNLSSEIAGIAFLAGGTSFSDGTTISGRASDELTELLRSCGLRWSVQNGIVQILRRNHALQSTAVRLSPSTGLVGIPSVDADGKVMVRALMIADLYPGRQVQIDSAEVSGLHRIEKTKHTGNTDGQEWYVDLECEELQVRT